MIRLVAISIFLAIVFAGEASACETADLLAALSHSRGHDLILTRPAMQHQWGSPDGLFLIHYDTEGPFAVYHPEEDENPVDGVPDYVNRVADYLYLSHQMIVFNLGYDSPPSDGQEGGDSRYDIYLNNT